MKRITKLHTHAHTNWLNTIIEMSIGQKNDMLLQLPTILFLCLEIVMFQFNIFSFNVNCLLLIKLIVISCKSNHLTFNRRSAFSRFFYIFIFLCIITHFGHAVYFGSVRLVILVFIYIARVSEREIKHYNGIAHSA